MATPRIYVDATPLIALARIGRLDLLQEVSRLVYATTGVWKEVTGHPTKPGVADLVQFERAGKIVVVNEGNAADFPQLGLGEAETLSAARDAKRSPGAVIVDEKKARKLLLSNQDLSSIASISTVGLVVLAKRRGTISRVQTILDELRGENFRMSRQLYEETLKVAGEWPPAPPPEERP